MEFSAEGDPFRRTRRCRSFHLPQVPWCSWWVAAAGKKGEWRFISMETGRHSGWNDLNVAVMCRQLGHRATAALVRGKDPSTWTRFGSDPTIHVVIVEESEQTLTLEWVVLDRKFRGQSGGHDLLKLLGTKDHFLTFDPNTNTTCLPSTDRGEEEEEALSDPCEQLNCAEHEWCGKKNGEYGCFCDEHHHRPNNESYDSSITCENSSGTMSVSRCQLFEAGFHSSALHLKDSSCNGTVPNGRLVFHFDNEGHLCGTVLRSNGTHFMYENTIQGNVDTHGSIISRQKNVHLLFCCSYPLSQALSMDVGINPLESVVRKKLPAGVGVYHMRMTPYQDAAFRFPFTSNTNIEMVVDERLYIEVRTEGVDQQQISTVLDSCWATPVNIANYPVRWDLIAEECPNPDDGTVELVQNGISTVARFSFKMFTFTNFSSIFIHCNVHLCLLRHNNCTAHCYPGHPTRFRRDLSYHDSSAISVGPLHLNPRSLGRIQSSSAPGQMTSVFTLIIVLLTVKILIQ
ncbi:pancreatic secretory granule membrane major glycoprotein GP2-like [Oryzias latipes]